MFRDLFTIRRAAQRMVPLLVWVSVVALAYWLHTESAGSGQARGLAEVKEFTISSVETGQLESVEVVLGQRVRRGQVVATLDTEMLDREIAVAEAELRELEAQVPAEGKSLELRRLQTERTFQAELEEAEIASRTAQAGYARDQADLAGLREEIARQRELVKQRLTSTDRMMDIEMKLAPLEESVAGWPSRIEAVEERLRAARGRLSEWRSTTAGRSKGSVRREQLRPLELRIIRQHETLALLRKRLSRMVLHANVDAHVVDILARQGSVVTPGDPIVVLVEDGPQQVIAYVAEELTFPVAAGDQCRLRRPDRPGQSIPGTVAGVAGAVAELPSRFWPNPARPRWGRKVFIQIDANHELDPGETFDITFDRNGGGTDLDRTVFAASDRRDNSVNAPTPLSVPSTIALRSRFEPSGLTWVEEMQRYIVVSDDTGLESSDDNAPWVFTMDRNGAIDPEPLVLVGLKAANDLEGVTAAPDGTIYMISSQSVNRRGKRNPARRLFIRARSQGNTLLVEDTVDFYDLLLNDARRDPSFYSSLSLQPPTRGQSPEVEIEGLAWHAGALYFGLKAPRDPGEKALIWKLERPDRPFEGGSLSRAGLTLWNKVLLEVDGERAGISELLFLDDGSLVIAATNGKDGALFHSEPATTGDLHTKTLVSWAGLKPEGLSLSPARDRLVVTFDRQQETPFWTQLEIPR